MFGNFRPTHHIRWTPVCGRTFNALVMKSCVGAHLCVCPFLRAIAGGKRQRRGAPMCAPMCKWAPWLIGQTHRSAPTWEWGIRSCCRGTPVCVPMNYPGGRGGMGGHTGPPLLVFVSVVLVIVRVRAGDH